MKRPYIFILASLLAMPIYSIDKVSAAEQIATPVQGAIKDEIIQQESIEGEVIIQFTKGANEEKIAKKSGLELEEKIQGRVALATFDDDKLSTEEIVKKLDKDDSVANVQPNYKYSTTEFANDPYSDRQWGLHNTGQQVNGIYGSAGMDINLPEAWPTFKNSNLKEAVVAVIDTGVDIKHPDLTDQIWVNEAEKNGIPGVDDDGNGYVDDVNGWDFYHDDNSVSDSVIEDTHGTHVAGIIGAAPNNYKGIAGIAPNAKIMPLKFIAGEEGTTLGAIKAIQYAKKMGVKIANLSWGGYGGYPGDTLYQTMKDSGILFISAAGNEGNNNDDTPSYPASYQLPNNISVAAIDNRGGLSSFSNFGQNSVDIAAPGVFVLSTVPRKFSSQYADYEYKSGTSMAAPHITGTAAMMLGINNNIDSKGIKDVIKMTGKPLEQLSHYISSGKAVNAQAAVNELQPIVITSIDELFDNSEFIQGKISKRANVIVSIEGSDRYSQETDPKGEFKIKIDQLPAGKLVMIRAENHYSQSEEKTVIVQKGKIENKPIAEARQATLKKQTFKDVPFEDWAYEEIEWAAAGGLVKGYPHNLFKPYNKLTEAQLAVVISRYYNNQIEKTPNTGNWYNKYYTYLKQNGLTLPGHKNSRVIEQPVKRLVIARTLAASQGVTGSDKHIIDWMYANKLTEGKGQSENKYEDFGSEDILNRSQISAFFKRMTERGMVKMFSKSS